VKLREPAPSLFPSVQAFVREARAGVCPLCDGPFPPRAEGASGRARVHCGSDDCLRLYQQLAAMDRRRRARSKESSP
jgi:hypothetical protein